MDLTTTLWKGLYRFAARNYDALAAQMDASLTEKELLHFCEILLLLAGRNGFKNWDRRVDLFRRAEAMGIHFMPVHFYSPVPDTGEVSEDWPLIAPWLNMRRDNQLSLLRELARFRPPADLPWKNPAICEFDVATYYAMIRRHRPARIVEVGCGYSTRFAAAACRETGSELICIDPYPLDFLASIPEVSRLIAKPVQEVPMEDLGLGAGDMLFIDSTHVSKFDSDVNHLFLRVLPELAHGVLVHVHDVCLPWDYPPHWLREKQIFWNESYLLAAMLQNSPWNVVLANHWVGKSLQTEISGLFPDAPLIGGGSFWMVRS